MGFVPKVYIPIYITIQYAIQGGSRVLLTKALACTSIPAGSIPAVGEKSFYFFLIFFVLPKIKLFI